MTETYELFAPDSLGELLQYLRRNPDRRIVAGGTLQVGPWKEEVAEEGPIVSLHLVKELRRVVRSDSHVDVGSAVPVARLLDVGERFLPRLLRVALSEMGPPPVRNTATLGGIVGSHECRSPVAAALLVLDARIELRRQGRSRWVHLAEYQERSSAFQKPGEIVTRIRIPAARWTREMFHTFGRVYPSRPANLAIAGGAQIEKSTVAGVRVVVLAPDSGLYRHRTFETDLIGRTVPLTERDRAAFGEQYVRPLLPHLPPLSGRRVLRLVIRFLSQLHPAE